MKEYIERVTALNALIRALGYCQCANDVITRIPAADVAEVRHGRWERVSTASGIISRVRCSVCAGTQPLTFENMPYCPTCGARMDEEDGHEIS
jgi:hypothetical protein|nr:MAG TPA: Rubredoxin loop, ELECTRON TRANSPORT [Caudoviricetes sp.]DAO43505.1 MAG TPA: Rubredoxin loop, ELECTRON TRANSPORT [Caudoviricetes sp.]DAT38608.1 MAG TPA: Rubredoxin loop, ELECTRON TRANSPORT [Caudoviricetes sp.]